MLTVRQSVNLCFFSFHSIFYYIILFVVSCSLIKWNAYIYNIVTYMYVWYFYKHIILCNPFVLVLCYFFFYCNYFSICLETFAVCMWMYITAAAANNSWIAFNDDGMRAGCNISLFFFLQLLQQISIYVCVSTCIVCWWRLAN